MNVRDLNLKSFTIIKRWGQVKKVATDFLETCMGHKGDRRQARSQSNLNTVLSLPYNQCRE